MADSSDQTRDPTDKPTPLVAAEALRTGERGRTMTFMFVRWCDRRFGERDAFERHVVDCEDTPPTTRVRREDGSEAGTKAVRAAGWSRPSPPRAGRALEWRLKIITRPD